MADAVTLGRRKRRQRACSFEEKTYVADICQHTQSNIRRSCKRFAPFIGSKPRPAPVERRLIMMYMKCVCLVQPYSDTSPCYRTRTTWERRSTKDPVRAHTQSPVPILCHTRHAVTFQHRPIHPQLWMRTNPHTAAAAGSPTLKGVRVTENTLKHYAWDRPHAHAYTSH